MISFLITHYNRPKSLEACIDSIRRLQLISDYEIVVSDDCSEKAAIEEIRRLRIDSLVLSEVNTGLSSNINRGLNQCKGDFIVYIQEDFALNKVFERLEEKMLEMLSSNQTEMIRLRSNIKFKQSFDITDDFALIPRFAFKNFWIDQYRYSDHPYMVKTTFYTKYGKYKENVNTIHGENEYMIRMMKLNPKIAICKYECVDHMNIEGSVREELQNSSAKTIRNKKWIKPIKRIVNALRFKFEFVFYNPNKRKLITIKNLRKVANTNKL